MRAIQGETGHFSSLRSANFPNFGRGVGLAVPTRKRDYFSIQSRTRLARSNRPRRTFGRKNFAASGCVRRFATRENEVTVSAETNQPQNVPIDLHATIASIPAQRKRRKTLSRRAGQYGSIEKRNGMWRGRFLADIPGQLARVKRAVILGAVREMTKSEARRRLVHIIQTEGLNAPHYVIPSAEVFSERVAAWRVSYLARRKPSTQKQMEWQVQKYLLPKWGPYPVETISAEQVNDWIGTLNHLSPASLRGLVKTLQLVLGRSFEKRRIYYPSTVDCRKETRCFTPEQMQRIVQNASGAWKVLFALAAETGMRSGELYGLRISDIDFARCLIHVRRSSWEGKAQSPKTDNAYRSIDISESLAALVRGHLGERTTGLVFPTRYETPLRNCYVVDRVLHRVLEKLGIERAGMHAFRHGRVSYLVESGAPMELIREWIGHGSDEMVRRYTHLRPTFRKRALAQIPELFGSKIDVFAPKATFAPDAVAVN